MSYASTAFRCRYPNCASSSIGYPSQQLRLQHESGHIQRVFCKILSCQYNRIGFSTRNALSSHTRKLHNETPTFLIPPKVRRDPLPQDPPAQTQTEPVLPMLDFKYSPVNPSPSPPSRPNLTQVERLHMAQDMLRQNPEIITSTDQDRFPPYVLDAQIRQILPTVITTWGQLKLWASQNPALLPGVDGNRLLMSQVLNYQDRQKRSKSVSVMYNAPPARQ